MVIASGPGGYVSLTKRQQTQTITKEVILRNEDMTGSHGEQHPDEDVCDDPSGQAVAVDSNGSVPEERDEGPGERSRDSGQVSKRAQGAVAPVRRMLVDEVRNQDNFRSPEMAAGPQKNPGKGEQVVENEVGSHVRCAGNQHSIPRKEMIDVADLRDKKDDPEGT